MIKICEHIEVDGDLIFDTMKEAQMDVKNYRAFSSSLVINCKLCKLTKMVYQTHNI